MARSSARRGEGLALTMDRLDDPDYPAYTTGRAAEVLGVRESFLRALDSAGAVIPERSAGGHRRYTRRQLWHARRLRELFDDGHNLHAARAILRLQDDLAAERGITAALRRELSAEDPSDGGD
jgi:MerR family transcriptional regulator, heat shock protein HspR